MPKRRMTVIGWAFVVLSLSAWLVNFLNWKAWNPDVYAEWLTKDWPVFLVIGVIILCVDTMMMSITKTITNSITKRDLE